MLLRAFMQIKNVQYVWPTHKTMVQQIYVVKAGSANIKWQR